MDIDEILEELIEKYDLNFEFSHKKSVEFQDKVIFLIKEYLTQIPKDAKIALRGGGIHTEKLFAILKELGYEKNLKCIIDKNCKQISYANFNCIPIEMINTYDIDTIIISSYRYKEEMEFELYNLEKSYKVINIYDYCDLNGVKLYQPFYIYKVFETCSYKQIFIYRKKYLNEADSKLKEFYLEKLILSCLNIRDFKYTIKYINCYIEKKYKKYKLYKNFLNELKLLLSKIKSLIAQRNYKDIIINWIDSLKYSELYQMKYLNEISQQSMFFENAFTFTPWTSATMKVIMTNNKTIDNNLLGVKKLNEYNSIVLNLFKSKGYEVKYIGNDYHGKVFEGESSNNDDRCQCSTLYQWLALKNLLLINKPCLFIIHNLFETHYPYINGGEIENLIYYGPSLLEPDDIAKFEKQRRLSKVYLDSQLEWYDKFYGDNFIRIYMSDHGIGKIYKDKRLHVLLFVKGKEINNIKCKQMFSYINFYYLLVYVLEPTKENFENLFNDFIEFQGLDFYNEAKVNILVNLILNQIECDYFFSDALSCRGIRTQYDKYILYATGEELYFVLPDEDHNKIDVPEYGNRINKLRKLAGNYFIDIYKYEEFKYSRRIYEALKEKNFEFLKAVLNSGKKQEMYL